MMIQMQIMGLILDQNLNSTIVVLLDPQRDQVLPIRIGNLEGNAIALGLRKVPTPRPMTHDLMKNILEEFHGEVVRVVVTELKDDTFYATIQLSIGGQALDIDARPSDAIALAVRTDAPIFCTDTLLNEAEALGILRHHKEFDEAGQTEDWLQKLTPDDFGKYKM